MTQGEAMWECPQCKESLEASFTQCWSCGYDKVGGEPEVPPLPAPPERPTCPVCEVRLRRRGRQSLRTGGGEGFFVQWSVHSERLWSLDVYACPRCRRVTFFEADEDA